MKKTVLSIIEKAYEELSYELYDIEEEKISKMLTIRLLTQKTDKTPVDLEDCEKISRYIAERLDDEPTLQEEYMLEVCSPGIVKNFKKPTHYEEFLNEEIEVKTYKKIDGFDAKKIKGKLEEVTDEHIILDGNIILYKDIAKANNIFEF